LRKVIAPYAVPQLVLEAAIELLSPQHLRMLPQRLSKVRFERERVANLLKPLPGVISVLPSQANFLLTRFRDPALALFRASSAGIQVRDARDYLGLGDALRISIGTREENDRLLGAWA
jgi:histidinol-phosphate aminotransferase